MTLEDSQTLDDIAGALKFACYVAWRIEAKLDNFGPKENASRFRFAKFMLGQFDRQAKKEKASPERIQTLKDQIRDWLAMAREKTLAVN